MDLIDSPLLARASHHGGSSHQMYSLYKQLVLILDFFFWTKMIHRLGNEHDMWRGWWRVLLLSSWTTNG
jgi:hypothetical protein